MEWTFITCDAPDTIETSNRNAVAFDLSFLLTFQSSDGILIIGISRPVITFFQEFLLHTMIKFAWLISGEKMHHKVR